MKVEGITSSLAKLTVTNSIRCYRFASFIKCVPFELISSKRIQVKEFESVVRRALWYVVNLLFYSYSLFQFVAFALSFYSKGLMTETAMHIFYLAIHLVGMLYFTALMWKTPECVNFINQMDFMMRRVGESINTREYFSLVFIIATIHYMMFVLVLSAPLLMAVIHWMNPESAMYAYSYMPESWKVSGFCKVFSVLLELAMVYWNFVLLTTYYIFWSGSVFQTILFLDGIKKQLKLNKGRGTIERSYKLYREVQMLNVLHTDLNAAYFTPGFFAVMVVLSVVFIYASLKTFHLLPLAFYLLFPSCGIFCVFLQTGFALYICKWRIMSQKIKVLFRQRVNLNRSVGGKDGEYKAEMDRRIASLRNIDNHQAFFGSTTLVQPQAAMDQIMSSLLLLLSF